MNKFVFALIALMMLFIAGCASTKGGTPIDLGDSSPLEEIAPYDDEAIEPLPDMVAAEI
jgi:hypothetical protein